MKKWIWIDIKRTSRIDFNLVVSVGDLEFLSETQSICRRPKESVGDLKYCLIQTRQEYELRPLLYKLVEPRERIYHVEGRMIYAISPLTLYLSPLYLCLHLPTTFSWSPWSTVSQARSTDRRNAVRLWSKLKELARFHLNRTISTWVTGPVLGGDSARYTPRSRLRRKYIYFI